MGAAGRQSLDHSGGPGARGSKRVRFARFRTSPPPGADSAREQSVAPYRGTERAISGVDLASLRQTRDLIVTHSGCSAVDAPNSSAPVLSDNRGPVTGAPSYRNTGGCAGKGRPSFVSVPVAGTAATTRTRAIEAGRRRGEVQAQQFFCGMQAGCCTCEEVAHSQLDPVIDSRGRPRSFPGPECERVECLAYPEARAAATGTVPGIGHPSFVLTQPSLPRGMGSGSFDGELKTSQCSGRSLPGEAATQTDFRAGRSDWPSFPEARGQHDQYASPASKRRLLGRRRVAG